MSEEDQYINELKSMPKERLDLTDHDKYWWICQVEGCKHKTTIRDYGISPVFYGRFRNGDWVDLNERMYLCSGHWKIFKLKPGMLTYKSFPSLNHIIKKD